MAHFKCKTCGGTLTFEPGAAVGICDACGAEQALPLPDDEPQDRADPARDEIYQNGLQRMREAVSKTDYKEAARIFSMAVPARFIRRCRRLRNCKLFGRGGRRAEKSIDFSVGYGIMKPSRQSPQGG